MRYIRNISDDQNKSGDTDNIFRFNLLQGEDIFNFGDYPISINIANSSGYILSMVPEKEFGNSVLKLDFNDQSLKSLTPDNYLLEVEVKFPDGTTATFPTKGGMPFTVNSNLKNTAGHLVPTVTFDEVLSAVDEKVNNYLATVVKGDKGDTGVVDTKADYTWTGTNTFTQFINARVKERGVLTGTVDILSMARSAADNSGIWKLNGVSIANSGQIDSIWGSLQINPIGDGSGAELIIVSSSGLGGMAQLISYGDASLSQLTWRKLANDETVVHTTGTETVAGDKSFTGTNTFNNKIIATAGIQGNADSATKLQTPHKINGVDFDGTSDINVNAANDSNLVHLTGTETVSGDKTFTGSTTFTQPIQGNLKTRISTFTDFSQVAKNIEDYAGNWVVKGGHIENSPFQDGTFIVVEVTPGHDGISGKITASAYDGTGDRSIYYLIANWQGIYEWHKIAQDSQVIHTTGTETVAGDKTFTGDNNFSGATTLKTGNYGLRVTTAGVQKTSDGGATWVNI